MTLNHLYNLLKTIGIPVAYKQFKSDKGSIPDPPYLVYYETRSGNFGADNTVHAEKLPIILELYTDSSRNFSLEQNIKTLLKKNGIYYETNHADIEDENLHIAYFEFTIIQ